MGQKKAGILYPSSAFLLQPFHPQAYFLALHTAQMGFLQKPARCFFALGTAATSQFEDASGVKAEGQEHSRGSCAGRERSLPGRTGSCLPAGAAGGAARWQQCGLRQAFACVCECTCATEYGNACAGRVTGELEPGDTCLAAATPLLAPGNLQPGAGSIAPAAPGSAWLRGFNQGSSLEASFLFFGKKSSLT